MGARVRFAYSGRPAPRASRRQWTTSSRQVIVLRCQTWLAPRSTASLMCGAWLGKVCSAAASRSAVAAFDDLGAGPRELHAAAVIGLAVHANPNRRVVNHHARHGGQLRGPVA